MKCTCDNGKVKTSVFENGVERSFEMNCIWCGGTGEMTPKQAEERKRFNEAWCRCGNPSGQANYYHYSNGAHGYTCADCGKIVQTG